MSSHGLTDREIAGSALALLLFVVLVSYASQMIIEAQIAPLATNAPLADKKLDAEIRQIKSDTLGSLFWLKVVALVVTVGGAVGGYLVGQSRTNRERIDFENRKNVDAVYQALVKELSEQSPILRAAAAAKLGAVLRDFPHEWTVSDKRREQMLDLTKKVLAAALSIEMDPKVLKTLTISIALHKPWASHTDEEMRKRSDLRELDLSGASAKDAYWARCDLSYADLYAADLRSASLRGSVLERTQFREAKLERAVLASTRCKGANFKMADLRHADFSEADLTGAIFESAKVHGMVVSKALLPADPSGEVDISEAGNGSNMQKTSAWFATLQRE